MLSLLSTNYRGCECCGYVVLHCRGERGSSLVTPCWMMVVGGCGEGEVKVWTCDIGERDIHTHRLTLSFSAYYYKTCVATAIIQNTYETLAIVVN